MAISSSPLKFTAEWQSPVSEIECYFVILIRNSHYYWDAAWLCFGSTMCNLAHRTEWLMSMYLGQVNSALRQSLGWLVSAFGEGGLGHGLITAPTAGENRDQSNGNRSHELVSCLSADST